MSSKLSQYNQHDLIKGIFVDQQKLKISQCLFKMSIQSELNSIKVEYVKQKRNQNSLQPLLPLMITSLRYKDFFYCLIIRRRMDKILRRFSRVENSYNEFIKNLPLVVFRRLLCGPKVPNKKDANQGKTQILERVFWGEKTRAQSLSLDKGF